MSPVKKYIDGIDSLRAISAIMVVLGHSEIFMYLHEWSHKTFMSTMTLGMGVVLFLVISGYVVFASLIPHLHELKNNFLSFWFAFLTRRFFRLAPTCYVWLFIILMLTYCFPSYFINFQQTLREAVGVLTYLYNYMCAFGFYLVKGAPMNLGYHNTLSAEEQFYFFLPILLFVLRARWIVPVSISIIVISFMIQRPQQWYYFSYDSFFYGILLASILQKVSLPTVYVPPFIRTLFLKIIGPLLIWVGIYLLVHATNYQINHRVTETAACISFFILVLVCFGVRPLSSNKLDALLVYIGKRSYTLYLSHIPTYLILNAIIMRLGWTTPDGQSMRFYFNTPMSILLVLVSFSILWLFVELIYRNIEIPARNWGKRISARRLNTPTEAMALAPS